MVHSVYVTGMEPGTGKSAIVLGMVELLSRRAGRVGVFRPLIASDDLVDADIDLLRTRYDLPQTYEQSYVATARDLHDVTDHAQYDLLFKRVLVAYRELVPSLDAVVIDGSDYTQASSAVEADLNLDLAGHLGSPVLLVVPGVGRDADQVLDAARLAVAAVTERGIPLLGLICNRVEPAVADDVRTLLPTVTGSALAFVLPEVAMLAAPTVTQVADALGARYLRPASGDGADREVGRVIIGAMNLSHFLERVSENDLVITPGDRDDIVAGSLAAHLSGTYPSIAGLVLTGGIVSEPIRRLVAGFGDRGVPVIDVDLDTYPTASAVGRVRGTITARSERKIALALGLFRDHVDTDAVIEQLQVRRPDRVTPLMFEHDLITRARADRRHIVLPEGEDDRVLAAADHLLRGDVVHLTLLGDEHTIRAKAAAAGLALPAVRIVDPHTSPWAEEFAATYQRLRAHKGVTLALARDTMLDASYFGTMMVHLGLADGMVSGATHTTAQTIRPAFEFIRTAPGVSTVSSVFLMCLADRVLVYGDCAVVPNPDADQLADIAVSAAQTAAMFGIEPRVAMLSYSTGESGAGQDVDVVRAATALARQRRPDLPIEGPIQYDAAIDADVGRAKLPGSPVAGRATVFVFPDLNTGNNTYKAVQRSAHAVAVGPVLQGLDKPVNDLSRGALVPDIVNTVAITAIQAQQRALGRPPQVGAAP